MKNCLFIFVFLAALAAAPSSRAGSNRITNPGFEVSPGMSQAAGWKTDGVQGFGTFADRSRSGKAAYKSWSMISLYQDFPAKPGEQWKASAWFLNPKGGREDVALTGDTIGRIRLEFKDAEMKTLKGSHSKTIDRKTSPNQWKKLKVDDFAPDQTAWIRVIINRVSTDGIGSIWVDDVEVKGGRP